MKLLALSVLTIVSELSFAGNVVSSAKKPTETILDIPHHDTSPEDVKDGWKYFSGYSIGFHDVERAEGFSDFLNERQLSYAVNLQWRTAQSMAEEGESWPNGWVPFTFLFRIGTDKNENLSDIYNAVTTWWNLESIPAMYTKYDDKNSKLESGGCFINKLAKSLENVAMSSSMNGGNKMLFALNDTENCEKNIPFDRKNIPDEVLEY